MRVNSDIFENWKYWSFLNIRLIVTWFAHHALGFRWPVGLFHHHKKLFSTGLSPAIFSYPFIMPSKPIILLELLISPATLNTISKKFLSTNRGWSPMGRALRVFKDFHCLNYLESLLNFYVSIYISKTKLKINWEFSGCIFRAFALVIVIYYPPPIISKNALKWNNKCQSYFALWGKNLNEPRWPPY